MKINSQKFKIQIIKKTIVQKNKKTQHEESGKKSNYELLQQFLDKKRPQSALLQEKKVIYNIATLKRVDFEKVKSAHHKRGKSTNDEKLQENRKNIITSTISNQFIRKSMMETITVPSSNNNNFNPSKSQTLNKNNQQSAQRHGIKVMEEKAKQRYKTRIKQPSNDVYAISCLSINLMEVPLKKRNSLIPSKFMPDKYSSLPPRRNVQFSKMGQKRYIVFNPTSDPQRKDMKKLKHFLYFLFKINYSNRIYVPLNYKDPSSFKKFKVFVQCGNNHTLIKTLLSQRFWIQVCSKIDEEVVFIWSSKKKKEAHSQQRSLILRKINNHRGKIRKEARISEQMYQNNKKILWGEDSIKVQQYLEEQRIKIPNWGVYETKLVTNHLPKNICIGTKKYLSKSLFHYYKHHKRRDPFEVIPKTYIVRSLEDPQFKRFLRDNDKTHKIWIVKPGQNTNQGEGINLAKTSEVANILKRYKEQEKHQTFLLQSYIERPFLYYDRKFDFRHYIMLTSVNGILKAYWYKEGYCRTSSEIYSMDNLQDKYIHLTNDAIQKQAPNYGRYEVANKISYSELQRYLDIVCSEKNLNLEKDILPKVKKIIVDVIHANYNLIDPQRNESNFEIFGLDFIIDKNFQPYLIEINTNPSLQINCPLLSRIIPSMLENCFRIALDPLLPPSGNFSINKKMSLNDHYLQNLKFQLIFDENHCEETFSPLYDVEDSDGEFEFQRQQQF